MKKISEDILASYVDALHPIIYINHFDTVVTEEIIKNIAINTQIFEFNNALGAINFNTKASQKEMTLEAFLKLNLDEGYNRSTFLVLKDIHSELSDKNILSLLKRIAEDNLYREDYNCTIFILSSRRVIPVEIENYITIFEVPLPSIDEINEIINNFISDMSIQLDKNVISELALSFKGLNEFQIKQILNLSYQDGGNITSEDKYLILGEKEQFIKKSGMLEIVKVKEEVSDLGGLENLKEWLHKKAKIFESLDRAIKFGVDVPKGVMIVGVPGCGKSLTAKITSKLFEIPLVRLDVGRLLGKYVGESEENMRKALSVAEAISPCVLWIDEIEKAFVGQQNSGSNEVTTRLFGQFLTWMQEKESTVFIVATSNNIADMPPEFLRKGRFDEIFFFDLPNDEERKKILEIHLKKRKKWKKDIDSIELIKKTQGFSGADLEAVVKETIEEAFIEGCTEITLQGLLNNISTMKSITDVLGDKIKKLKEQINNIDIKQASKKGES